MRNSARLSAAAVLLLGAQALAQDWPQWRGPNRDGISSEKGLLKQWPEGGPKVVWQVDTVGVGYSSIAIKDGKIYTQGELNGLEHILCLAVEDGKLLWAVRPEPNERWLEEHLTKEVKGLDRNSDGTIDETEALARFGWSFNRWDRAPAAEGRAGRLFSKLDRDGDGKLSPAEASGFRDDFRRIDAEDKSADAAALARSRAQDFVARLDKDADGRLSERETRGSGLDFGADSREPNTNKGDGFLTSAEIEAYLLKREPGRDGWITAAELEAFYVKEKPRGDGVLTRDELKAAFGGYRDGTGDGPRGTPTLDGDRLYVEGALGDLVCLEAATGKLVWHVNLQRDLGGSRPGWAYSESPLILGDHLIVTPGGKQGTLAALDKKTGAVAWRSGGITEGAQYSSPQLAEIGGVRQIVQFAHKTCFGVTADGGRLLWQYGGANNGTANCTDPIVHDSHVFASSAYGTGGGLARIAKDGEAQKAEQVYFERKMENHHGGIVKVGDYLYGCNNSGPLCMNFLTGEIKWQARGAGKGSLVVADGMLYLLGEGHQVALAEATPEAYRERGKFKLTPRGHPSWAHPVVAGGRFYIRDQQYLTAYDVREPR